MNSDSKILIADADKTVRSNLKKVFEDKNFTIFEADNGRDTLRIIKSESPDVLISELQLNEIDGIEIIRRTQPLLINSIVIILTDHASINSAMEAGRLGIHEFIEKPVQPEQVLAIVNKAITKLNTEQSAHIISDELINEFKLIGKSAVMQNIHNFVKKAAASEANVLITGNNGTGKDHLAQYIHLKSARRQEPFINVNCAAIPTHLMESELFGFEKGAFTGAYKTTTGKFEQANHGTILLNEIAELTPELQAKLLHILESHTIEHLGGDENLRIDVRVIAATNIELELAIRRELFRKDLFYRLNVLHIHLPDLYERQEDIVPLFEYFMKRICKKRNLPRKTLAPDALTVLYSYNWPGNIRQLKNIATNLTIMHNRPQITGEDIQNIIAKDSKSPGLHQPFTGHSLSKARNNFERNYILRHLDENDWNVRRTAEILDLDRTHLYRLMQKHSIQNRRDRKK
ncbi:MAG: sigma-54 dependent transcriptional regulator [Calditrichaceae bacterium]|jgi:two-component system nitrogen regulation response regulator NtrX